MRSKVVKLIEAVSRMVVARGWGGGGLGSCLMGCFSLGR